MKICKNCNIKKNADDFTYGYSICKKCRSYKAKLNRADTSEYRKNYYKDNKDIIKEKHGEYFKEYQKSNKDKINNKRKENTLSKITNSVRKTINKPFKVNKYEKNKYEKILGCSYSDYKIYLESKFEVWMTWDNYGLYNGELQYGWDIDHVIPLCNASTDEEFIKLKHYTNTQPLDSKVNRYVKRNLQRYNFICKLPNNQC